MKVLHIEMGRHLYGGARQVAYLLDGLDRFPGKHVLVCVMNAEIASAIRNPAVRVHAVPCCGDIDVRCINRLRHLIRREQPDLMHIHSRRGDAVAALAGRLEKIPMVFSRRVDNPPHWIDSHLKFPLFRRIITISEGIRDVLIEAGVEPSRIVCVPSAVDTEVYCPGGDLEAFRAEFGLTAEHVVAAVIAQFIPRKGHDVLFQALPAVLSRHPNLRVLLFGQGPLEEDLRGQVKDRGLEEQVIFAGFRRDMQHVIPCLDLLIHPARMEGLGVSLLETAACAVPIIASRAGGIPEIVQDGVNGRLIEPGDSGALADALNELLDNPEHRREFGEAGRRRVLERFSVEKMVEGNWGVYEEVVG